VALPEASAFELEAALDVALACELAFEFELELLGRAARPRCARADACLPRRKIESGCEPEPARALALESEGLPRGGRPSTRGADRLASARGLFRRRFAVVPFAFKIKIKFTFTFEGRGRPTSLEDVGQSQSVGIMLSIRSINSIAC
jgi:hypothetical protein